MPKLSIIITSYNHQNFIAKTIRSFLDEEFQDFEMIIIDDCSSDKSREVVKTFDDKRIKTIFLEENIGFCAAANIAIKQASGKYLRLIASDDFIAKGALKKQVDFLDNNSQYAAHFSRMTIIDENNNILEKKTKRFDKYFLCQNFSPAEMLNHFFCKGNFLAAPSAIFRAEALLAIGGFDERIIQTHDFDLWARFCLKGFAIYISDERLVFYRQLSGNKNMSANTDVVNKRLVFDYEKILENFLEIKTVDFLIDIFPELKSQKDKIAPNLIPFFLAQEALKIETLHHKQFALSTIFKILKDKEIAEILQKDFGFFINKDFRKMVNENPLGNFNQILTQKPFHKRFVKKIGNKISNLLNF